MSKLASISVLATARALPKVANVLGLIFVQAITISGCKFVSTTCRKIAAEGLRPLRGQAPRSRSRDIPGFLDPRGVRESDRRFVPHGESERSRPLGLRVDFLFDGDEDQHLPPSRRKGADTCDELYRVVCNNFI